MLIVLGGFLGNGRKMFAHRLAKRKNFHLYDTDAKKMRRFELQRGGAIKEMVQRPYREEQRLFLYKNVLADFSKISKMHPDMIIEDSFHRTAAREYFLTEARKYFKPVVFIWIDSDEAHVAERIRHMVTTGAIGSYEEGVRRRKSAAKHFTQDHTMRVFKCVKGDEAELDALWSLICGMTNGDMNAKLDALLQ